MFKVSRFDVNQLETLISPLLTVVSVVFIFLSAKRMFVLSAKRKKLNFSEEYYCVSLI